MRILLLGDIVGRSGRDALISELPGLKARLALDFVVVNGENAAGGFGITPQICDELFAAGADCITTGNHVWDQKDIIPHFSKEPRLLRPGNLPKSQPGKGTGVYKTTSGKTVVVLHAMGQLGFREMPDNPFLWAQEEASRFRLGTPQCHAVLVDFHAEATSEKTAMGHILDGLASVVIGTHTHVPTADTRILPKGTAYQTDIGMCGDYNSIIGIQPDVPIASFLTRMKQTKMQAATGEATLCGLYVETDDATGLATLVKPFRHGGMLSAAPL